MAEKLGARKNSSWKAICTAPDFCKTPVGSSTPPIPYQVIADLGQSENCVPSVRFNGDPCCVLNPSIVPKCTGDEPGTAKGVRSGTVSGKVKPTGASTTVRATKKRVVRDNDPCTLNDGNCPGLYTAQPAPGGAMGSGGKPAGANPAAKLDTANEVQAAQEKKGIWGMISGPVHFALGAAGFIPGLGAVPDLLDAGVYALEGDAINAGLSLGAAVPLAGDAVKAGTIATKAGKQVAKAAAERVAKEAAEKAARETAERLAKEAAEKALKEKLEREAKEKIAREAAEKKVRKETGEAATEGAKKEGKDGAKVKNKGKLKCGEYGQYGALKKKTGAGKLDRDHIPSKAALKERAVELAKSRYLDVKDSQLRAIENLADAIAIPKAAHRGNSPTFGSRNTDSRIRGDAGNLGKAANRDLDAMIANIGKYNKRCAKAYRKAAEQLKEKIRKNDHHFDDFLNNILDNF
jgi:hypothetical protein